jgi:proteasome maturation protein
MISSLQLVPQHEFTTKKVGENDFGVQDVMRDGFRVIKSEFNQHPLEQRLEKWSDTQQTLKYTMLRNTFGMGVPVMLQMEDYLLSQVFCID